MEWWKLGTLSYLCVIEWLVLQIDDDLYIPYRYEP